jgi:type IV pilus assembly protein PilN
MKNNNGFVFVNLMPFRDQIKKEQMKQIYMILSFFTAIAIFFVFIAYSFVNMQLDSQKSRNSYIERENKKLDEDIQKIANLQAEINNTLGKRKVVESLQVNRVDAVNILNEVSTQLPEGMKITEISSKPSGNTDLITIKGTTNSNNKVSAYMTQLVNSNVFIDPVLIEIKSNNLEGRSVKNKDNTNQLVDNNFHINISLKNNIYDNEEKENKLSVKNKK